MPKTARNDQRFDVEVHFPLNGDAVDQAIYLANRSVRLVAAREVHSVAGSDGSAVTLQLKKCTGTVTAVGVLQAETGTVTGAATTSASLNIVVTGAGITGSPVTIPVAVTALDSAATVAGLIRTALGLNAAVTALYNVIGSGADYGLQAKATAANDATLNIALVPLTTGVPAGASSANTTAGVATGLPVLSTPFDLKGAANTVQVGAFATTANIQNLAAGDRLSADIGGTTTAVAGVLLSLTFEYA